MPLMRDEGVVIPSNSYIGWAVRSAQGSGAIFARKVRLVVVVEAIVTAKSYGSVGRRAIRMGEGGGRRWYKFLPE